MTTKVTDSEEVSSTFDHPGGIGGRRPLHVVLAIAYSQSNGTMTFGRWRIRGQPRRDLATLFFHRTQTDDVAVGVDTGDNQEIGILEPPVERRTTDAVVTLDGGAVVGEVPRPGRANPGVRQRLHGSHHEATPDVRVLHGHSRRAGR